MKTRSSPEELAEELLGRPYAELDREEQVVLQRVARGEVIGLDADERAAANITYADRLADRVASIGGSWGFICAFAVVLLAWMVVNSGAASALGLPAFDYYPYIFLNLILSMLAAIQAPVIMMSQNRQARKDRVTARHDYEVNLRTTIEILRLHRKVDRLFNKLGQMDGSNGHNPENGDQRH